MGKIRKPLCITVDEAVYNVLKRMSKKMSKPVSRIVEEAVIKYVGEGIVNLEKVVSKDKELMNIKPSIEKKEVISPIQYYKINRNKIRPLKKVILDILRNKLVVNLRELEESVYKAMPVRLDRFHRKLRELINEGLVREIKIRGETFYTLSHEVKSVKIYGYQSYSKSVQR